MEELDDALASGAFLRLPLPWPAAFLAGKYFVAYRRAGGIRRSPLPDFYIGAHAAIARMPLLTRHAARYGMYLPQIELIDPTAGGAPSGRGARQLLARRRPTRESAGAGAGRRGPLSRGGDQPRAAARRPAI